MEANNDRPSMARRILNGAAWTILGLVGAAAVASTYLFGARDNAPKDRNGQVFPRIVEIFQPERIAAVQAERTADSLKVISDRAKRAEQDSIASANQKAKADSLAALAKHKGRVHRQAKMVQPKVQNKPLGSPQKQSVLGR